MTAFGVFYSGFRVVLHDIVIFLFHQKGQSKQQVQFLDLDDICQVSLDDSIAVILNGVNIR